MTKETSKLKINQHNKSTYFHNATYEYVVSLVIDPVLQHHFVHHGDENLVLATQRRVVK